MKKGERKREFKKRGWWWVPILLIVFFLILGAGKKGGWFSPTPTWSDVANLIQEVGEKGQELNQILQEALQPGW